MFIHALNVSDCACVFSFRCLSRIFILILFSYRHSTAHIGGPFCSFLFVVRVVFLHSFPSNIPGTSSCNVVSLYILVYRTININLCGVDSR